MFIIVVLFLFHRSPTIDCHRSILKHRLLRSSPIPQVISPDIQYNRTNKFSLLFPIPTIISNQDRLRNVSTTTTITKTIVNNNIHNVPNVSLSSSTTPSIPTITTTTTDLPININESTIDNVTNNSTNINNSTISLDDINSHLFRSGRETHDAFVRRIINAVSGDSHNTNRYVHLHKLKNVNRILTDSTPNSGTDQAQSDLGLPDEIAHDYIDGVNPPKFPGIKAIIPLMTDASDEWRHRLKVNSSKKQHHVNRNQTIPSINDNKHSFGHQSERIKIRLPVITQKIGINDRLAMGNSNVQRPSSSNNRHQLTSSSSSLNNNQPSTQSESMISIHKQQKPQSNNRHNQNELSVLLKQEFDAKNEELNQTLAETMSIGLGGDLMGTTSYDNDDININNNDGTNPIIETSIDECITTVSIATIAK
ncbi:hypothetical protein BLOT_011116 [Blomia tropicalis]|nr:hypothetical protein BLOT_011116 [Blomia tropicalis]